MVFVQESILEKIEQSIKEQQQFFKLLEREKTPLELELDQLNNLLSDQQIEQKKANTIFVQASKISFKDGLPHCSPNSSPSDSARCSQRANHWFWARDNFKENNIKLEELKNLVKAKQIQVDEEIIVKNQKTAQTADKDEVLDTPTSREFNDLPVQIPIIKQPKQDNTLRNLLLIAGLMVLI